GNPDVQRHLVVSVAKATYLALPRGCIVPHHALILPIGHHQAFTDCPPDVVAEVSLQQFQSFLSYKTAIGCLSTDTPSWIISSSF
ncbi:MAG: hypothetical protein V2I33_21170, partial [Kangiellaceae bacterium]|nr:hypothetical protein [Kangiellaceae bacterium]